MSPRATSTEEPDGGNLLVRIWRGAGVGNLPAYSTSPFSPPAPPPRRPSPPLDDRGPRAARRIGKIKPLFSPRAAAADAPQPVQAQAQRDDSCCPVRVQALP